MKSCLVLLTKNYPYDKGEEFIESEMPIIAKAFDRVVVLATSTNSNPLQTRPLPENAEARSIARSRIEHGLPAATVRLFSCGIWRSCVDAKEKELLRHGPKKRAFLAYFLAKSEVVYAESAKLLDEFNLNEYEAVTYYSYWLYDTAMAAVKLKKYHSAGAVRAVSRAHGYDLYAARNSTGYLPLRRYLLENLDAVYPCSAHGSAYLAAQYPEFEGKIHTARLGTADFGTGPVPAGDMIRIVSCCHLVPVKRVELLAQALSLLAECGLALEWTHFGGGESLESLRAYAAEHLGFMKTNFPGGVQNAELMKYYEATPVNVFVNTSASEGIPVSIMEAASFGVPAIATDVGGTRELVRNGETGVLLPQELTPALLADALRAFFAQPPGVYLARRAACRALWEESFCAQRNFEKFGKDLFPV